MSEKHPSQTFHLKHHHLRTPQKCYYSEGNTRNSLFQSSTQSRTIAMLDHLWFCVSKPWKFLRMETPRSHKDTIPVLHCTLSNLFFFLMSSLSLSSCNLWQLLNLPLLDLPFLCPTQPGVASPPCAGLGQQPPILPLIQLRMCWFLSASTPWAHI